ncbi:uncharacterized protein LOC116210000 isoform X2 [Punica granatum]|uniref:Uncharacterized protein LOC116210000 isoform X2 n=1 Tax=Punica granatum TaxID=22663 RepID=A0A6P8DQH8_PUNGR|nr:uncharacterized protein LOC116210000 isoform X2 [Punica granatum]
MSDEGEKICPLCTEEMDLTDQQLKPCKCGYEICVWCWHHIMEMAEKDGTEGRCPACRVPYDKEKIVGMAAKCERLVAEINMEKKSKVQKAKTKPSDGRKQLSNMRVIQRNLVYVVGLPLNLADEDLLQRRDYFGQYGKVLKVSMSRTSAGVVQQFPNNTCSVYITYAKEEEAVRCIQSVHGFVLDGRALRVCFGTTKYCHAWLRNMPCTNPECLYLHEIGSQEDSYTKDEIISAYTRVQQITNNMNTLHRRAGNMLPPPVDDYCNNTSASPGKPIVKDASNSIGSIGKGSPPNGGSGRSVVLPAAASWGTRASNYQSSSARSACLNGHSRQGSDSEDVASAFSSVVASTVQAPKLHSNIKKPTTNDGIHTLVAKDKLDTSSSLKQHANHSASDKYLEVETAPTVRNSSRSLHPLLVEQYNGRIDMPSSVASSINDSRQHSCFESEEESDTENYGKVQNLCSDVLSISIDSSTLHKPSSISRAKSSVSGSVFSKAGSLHEVPQNICSEHHEEPDTKRVAPVWSGGDLTELIRQSDSQNTVPDKCSEVEDDILSFDSQRHKDPEVVHYPTYGSRSVGALHSSHYLGTQTFPQGEPFNVMAINAGPVLGESKVDNCSVSHLSNGLIASNGHWDSFSRGSAFVDTTTSDHSLLRGEGNGTIGRFLVDAVNADGTNHLDNPGEHSIISNILSMDFAFDDSLTSPQDLSKLLGEIDAESGSLNKLSSRKVQNSNQSRFSFARQEEQSHACDAGASSLFKQFPMESSYNQDLHESRESYVDKFGITNGFFHNPWEADNFACSAGSLSSSKSSGVSGSQMLAPPGFSVPNRAPPPGFSSHERTNHAFDAMTRNYSHEMPSLMRNSQQPHLNGNIGTPDIEFMDPAILAVGKGRLQSVLNKQPSLDVRSFPSQFNDFDNEARLKSLMQRSLSQQQKAGYVVGDGYSLTDDSYGISQRILDRAQVGSLSAFAQLSMQHDQNGPISNGHWDGLSDIHGGNGLGMAELLRNERLGLNKFYDGYEDPKMRMATSGDIYRRTFGM